MSLTSFISSHAGLHAFDHNQAAVARARCRNFLINLRLEGLNEYKAAGHDILMCTLGPGDAVYVPPGLLFHEQVGNSGNVYGIKVPLMIDHNVATDLFRALGEDWRCLNYPWARAPHVQLNVSLIP